MSHQQIFMSFRRGDVRPTSFDALVEILVRHGCIVGPRHQNSRFVAFPLGGNDYRIGDSGAISLNGDAAVEFGIERPRYDKDFYSMAFDLIKGLDLCMLISSGEVIYVSGEHSIAELPESLRDVARVVQDIKDFADS